MAEISSVIQHASITGDNIHVAYAGTYADETARLAAKLDASMEGKLYRQLSDNGLWMLVSAAKKTWISLGKDTAKYLGNGGDDDDPMTFHWDKKSGQPSQVWGGSDGKNMYVYDPANFNVNSAKTADYATSAGSASANGGTAHSAEATPNISINYNTFNTLPQGGTWRLIESDRDGFLKIKGEYAGGTYIGYSKNMYIRIA